ncbi:S8 family serine peptidase [Candidatus Peregrinibacteria bacterium]|nr:S8 family serine peptidase [Candidatus Peregrinibacteria bacterium]
MIHTLKLHKLWTLAILGIILYGGMYVVYKTKNATAIARKSVIEAKTAEKNINNVLLQKLALKAQSTESVRIIIEIASQKTNFAKNKYFSELQKAVKSAQDEFLSTFSNTNIQRIKRYRYMPFIALEVNAATLKTIATNPNVINIYEDEILTPSLSESIGIINADDAWTLGNQGAGQAVGIIDTGIDSTHPFLTGKIVSEACYSDNLCPGGGQEETGPGTAQNCDVTKTTQCEHGTHIAGIVAGKNGYYSGKTLNGVAPNANLISIQVYSMYENKPEYCGSDAPCVVTFSSDVTFGFERVLELALDENFGFSVVAVNGSLQSSTGYSTSSECDTKYSYWKTAFDNLRAANVAPIMSSGNNSYTDKISAPGCLSNAISVGNTENNDTVRASSNSAAFLSLLAPGTSILSSIPGGSYGEKTGTSQATPHVAGSWALIREMIPNASVNDVLTFLKQNGVLITDSKNGITTARIDVGAASQSCQITGTTEWFIEKNCILRQTLGPMGAVRVGPSGGIFIQDGAALDIDFVSASLTIEQGGKMLIEPLGKIY